MQILTPNQLEIGLHFDDSVFSDFDDFVSISFLINNYLSSK